MGFNKIQISVFLFSRVSRLYLPLFRNYLLDREREREGEGEGEGERKNFKKSINIINPNFSYIKIVFLGYIMLLRRMQKASIILCKIFVVIF